MRPKAKETAAMTRMWRVHFCDMSEVTEPLPAEAGRFED